uniref:Uncharacterized protein n=1 Tax=Microcebus murinus TaxID=30608 RepID=A0A8C5XWB8_MICMU
MWCLEKLCLGPERLRQGGDWLLPGRAREARARTTAACANVLTPDRIPEFCIPPRLVPSLALAALRHSWGEKAEADDGAGPTDWAALAGGLSLPHLPARAPPTASARCSRARTRRKESLFLGDRPPAGPAPGHTYGGGGRGPLQVPVPRFGRRPHGPAARRPGTRLPYGPAAPPPARPRGLLSARVRPAESRSGRARSVSSGRGRGAPPRPPSAASAPPARRAPGGGAPWLWAARRRPAPGRRVLPGQRRLRIRLLRADARAGARPAPSACRVSLVLQPPRAARRQRGSVLRPAASALGQDCCFGGLAETSAPPGRDKGRGLERGRLLGQGELPLGALLLL